MLRQAENLIEQGIHPTIIVHGYRMAGEKSKELLKGIAIDIKRSDTKILKNLALTAMAGKGVEASRTLLSDLVVKAATSVAEIDGTVDMDNIKVEKKVGGFLEDSEIVHGIVIDKERVHPGMPTKITNAKVMLINAPIEYTKPEVDAQF